MGKALKGTRGHAQYWPAKVALAEEEEEAV